MADVNARNLDHIFPSIAKEPIVLSAWDVIEIALVGMPHYLSSSHVGHGKRSKKNY